MKLYLTLTDTLQAVHRRPNKQVISILNINSKGYFVFRSSLSKEQALKETVTSKFLIADKINKNRFQHYDCDAGRELAEKREKGLARLRSYILQNEEDHFPNDLLTLHSEENLILSFSQAIELFKQKFPHEKVNSLEIYLSHSPCSENSRQKGCSEVRPMDYLNHLGCEKKLEKFFKGNYKSADFSLFVKNPKIRVKYYHRFDPNYHYPNDLFQEADLILKSKLGPVFQ